MSERNGETTLFIHDLNAAVSPAGSGPLRGRSLGELEIHAPASVAISGDQITAVGKPQDVLREHPPGPECVTVDGRHRVALPGLVDCHTHACFLGDRAHEFELRARGASYEELHAAGGGILSTVVRSSMRPPPLSRTCGCCRQIGQAPSTTSVRLPDFGAWAR